MASTGGLKAESAMRTDVSARHYLPFAWWAGRKVNQFQIQFLYDSNLMLRLL